jgi:excinuclease ABC subunit A
LRLAVVDKGSYAEKFGIIVIASIIARMSHLDHTNETSAAAGQAFLSAGADEPTHQNGRQECLPHGELIRIRGARVHNLKDVDVDIPRNRFVVMTGVSGSGKSSLALDTLYAEGQRQYIETVSRFARQMLQQMERPDVDLVDGLQPTLCIDQRGWVNNPRSTVATVTEIYDYLRLLFARVGRPHCPQCGAAIVQQSLEQIQEALERLPAGTKLMLLAPLVRGRKGKHDDIFRAIRKAGLVRARIDGEVMEIENVPELNPRKNHSIDAVVDRLIVKEGASKRLGESLRLAAKLGEGVAIGCYLDVKSADEKFPEGRWRDALFSTRYACPNCNVSLEDIEPRTFSFNSPYGACPVCEGIGTVEQFDPDLVIPDRSLSLEAGAVAPWRGLTDAQLKRRRDEVEPLLASEKLTWETPLADYSPAAFSKLIDGDQKKFLGVLMLVEKEFATATKRSRKEQLETFRGHVTCGACGGSRLRPEALGVRVAGYNIHDATRQSLGNAQAWFEGLKFDEEDQPVAAPIVREITSRLAYLNKVGVSYLTLDRAADTLSGGEMQRVRLATSIGSGLVGVCYILDEPSIGLHQRDNDRLIQAMRELQQQGNTVLVVEHDDQVMREADWLIDIGPGAGDSGGRVVACGTPEEVSASETSLTGGYLSGRVQIPVPVERRRTAKTRSLTIAGVTTNNLKNVEVHFPTEAFVCVTGVSGSGKSSLVNETLAPALMRRLNLVAPKPGPHTSLRGASRIDKVINIDQSPIGRTPRSNPATYTGIFDEVRKVFAGTREAKQRGFSASRFSFNNAAGRCDECQGQGQQKIEMNFLPDLYVDCPACHGQRFNAQTLAVRYRGKSIADVLAMPVGEALEFFENFSVIHRSLESLDAVGLGYLSLGQASNTLSGGEAQRIKLATELAKSETGSTLYLLDEPTTGLHFADTQRLLDVLQRLVDKGNTVIVIEHNLDVIKCADWIIDIGPEGGAGGGEVVAAGTPEEIAAVAASHTGRFLREVLDLSERGA